MKRLAMVVALFALGSVCLAQDEAAQPMTPEDEIRALAREFVDHAMAGDTAALEERLVEPFVMIMPDEIVTREAFLASTETPPFEPKIGEFTPEILGDLALVLIPVEVEQGMLPPSTHPEFMFVGALQRVEEAWELLFAAVLVTIQPDREAPNQLIMADQWLKQSFPVFRKEFADARAEGRLDLAIFSDPSVLAGPWGEDGAFTAVSLTQVQERAEELGSLIAAPAAAAPDPGEFVVAGLGAALFSRTVAVSTAEGPELRRELVIAQFSQETMQWRVAAFLDMPGE